MNNVPALECALPVERLYSAVWILKCYSGSMLPHSALVNRDSHRPGFVLCLVPAVAGCIPVSMTCLTEFLFLTASFKILKW